MSGSSKLDYEVFDGWGFLLCFYLLSFNKHFEYKSGTDAQWVLEIERVICLGTLRFQIITF